MAYNLKHWINIIVLDLLDLYTAVVNFDIPESSPEMISS